MIDYLPIATVGISAALAMIAWWHVQRVAMENRMNDMQVKFDLLQASLIRLHERFERMEGKLDELRLEVIRRS